MTTETDSAIEAGPRRTTQETPDPTFRLTADNIARLRTTCAGRWLARLARFGEQVWCEHDTPFGLPGPVIVQLLPEAGPSLAASAVGVFVHYAQRPSDGLVCGFRPEGRLFLKAPDPRVTCGYVERAWRDRYGVVGVIALWGEAVRADLGRLEARDALAAAQLCLGFTADFRISRGPWQLPIADVVAGRAFSVEFTALSHSLGSRVVRRLAHDEEPDEDEIIPSDPRVLLPRWSGLSAEDASAVSTADTAPGSVTTPTVAVGAITNRITHVGNSLPSTTSGTFADISGESVSPTISSASSEVFVSWTGSVQIDNFDAGLQSVQVQIQLVRGSTVLQQGVWLGPVIGGSTIEQPFSLSYQDAGQSGSTTYKIRWKIIGILVQNVQATLLVNAVLQAVEFKR